MNTTTSWMEWYYIATYVLAAVAVAGFIWSILSSRQTAQSVERVQKSLGTMVEPFIKVADHAWGAGKSGQISCQELPVQVTVALRNFSLIPVQLHRTSLRTFFGEKELTSDLVANVEVVDSDTVIIAPGEQLRLSQVQPTEFPKHLAMAAGHPLFGPQFTVRVEAEFSRIGSAERRIYRTRQILVFDCQNPQRHIRRCVEEVVLDVPPIRGPDAAAGPKP